MQVDFFEIVSSELVNPSNNITFYYQLALIALVTIILILTDPFLESRFKERMSTAVGRFKLWTLVTICAVVFTVTSMVMIEEHRKSNYPNEYTSHVTCSYQLKSDTEEVEHTTLILRNNGSTCSPVGKRVIRIRTEKSVEYYDVFETPN